MGILDVLAPCWLKVLLQVREVAEAMTTQSGGGYPSGLRWQSSALLALQEATEAYLVHLFEDTCVRSCYAQTLTDCPTTPEIYVQFTRSV